MTPPEQNAREGFSLRAQMSAAGATPAPPAPSAARGGQKPFTPPRKASSSGLPPVRVAVTAENMLKSVDWQKILRGSLRRAWLAAIVIGIFAGLGILGGIKLRHVKYDSHSSLLYRPDRQKQILAASGSTFAMRALSRNTAISLIRRASNMDTVAKNLKSPVPADDLKWMIQTKAEKNSEIVVLDLSGAPSKDLAMKLVNEAARVAIEDNAAFYRSQATQAVEAFRRQAQLSKAEMDGLTDQIAAYQTTNHLIQADADAKSFLDSVTAISERTSIARIAYQSQLIRIENFKNTITNMPDEVVRESFEDSPIKRRISNSEVALMEARTKYGPDNPRVRAIEDEIKEMRKMLTDKTYDQNREQVFEANPTKKQFEAELLRMEAELTVLSDTVRQVEAEKAGLERRFAHLPRQQLELAEMQQRRQAAGEMYQALQKTADNAAFAASLDLADFEPLEAARGAEPRRSPLALLAPIGAIIFGLVGGAVLCIAVEFLDSKWRTVRQLELAYSVPVAGAITRADIAEDGGFAQFLPICRALYERWCQRHPASAKGVLCVASSTTGEGKSSIAFHVARYWQALGIRSAYVDFDSTPNPHLAGDDVRCGAERYLRGTAEWADIQAIRHGVTCFKVRERTPDLLELLSTPAMARLWDSLTSQFAFVVIEAPGATGDPSAGFLASLGDEVVFVIGSPVADKPLVNAALDMLDRSGARPTALVLNMAGKAEGAASRPAGT
jgi:polysaccharide biosynthesis transport protein